MYRDRDVVTKGEVIQHVHSKEHEDIRKPSNQWNASRFEEEGRMRSGEMGGPSEGHRGKKLNKGYEESLNSHKVGSTKMSRICNIPLSGSSLTAND